MIQHETPNVTAARRWLLDGVDFVAETARGPTIRGRFGRVGGWYEIGPDGTMIQLQVDATSVELGNGFWDSLLRSAETGRLADQPEVRFASTRVRSEGDGTLRVDGLLQAAAKIVPVAFDADVKPVEDGLRLTAAINVDRRQLGKSADRLAAFLPVTIHLTALFAA
jgi:polyisoprenoid-binding protein YceI